MKRKFLIAILLCFIACDSFSQSNNFVALSIGPAFPVGEFASMNPESDNSGLAKIGWSADLSYVHKLNNSHFGLIADVRARINSIDINKSLAPLMEDFVDYTWPTIHKFWQTGAIMVGGYHSFPITNKISIEENLMAGIAYSILPAYHGTAIKPENDFAGDADVVIFDSEKGHAIAFSAAVKIDAAIKITEKIALIGGIDFWYLKPNFKNLSQEIISFNGINIPYLYSPANSRQPISAYGITSSFKQAMNTVDLTLGIKMDF